MSYYFFNKCERDHIDGLKKIAEDLGLTEEECIGEEKRFWRGEILSGENNFYKEFLILYDPKSETPLMIQTNIQEDTPQVKRIIKSLTNLCRPTEIYQEPFTKTKHDLEELLN